MGELLKLIVEQCEYAVKNNIPFLALLGDLFTSRVSQRQDVLEAMGELFDIIHSYELHAFVIPGNHDKVDYYSTSSFLSPYKNHPAITLIEDNSTFEIEGMLWHFLPFFNWGSEAYNHNFKEILDNVDPDKVNILFSHMAVQGSVNNDGSKVEKGAAKISDFKVFDKVYFGHYHNTQKVGKNIFHLPPPRQNNFGEDKVKGFTILYNDLSHEIIKTNFTEYTVYEFDLGKTPTSDIIDISNEIQGNGNNRFILTGKRDIVNGFKSSRFEEMGINVQKKHIELEEPSIDLSTPTKVSEVLKWDEEKVKGRFEVFCEKERLNHNEGIELLSEIINTVE